MMNAGKTGIAALDPFAQAIRQLKGTGPFPEPEQFLLHCPEYPFRIGIALWITIAGKSLFGAHLTA